MFRSIFSVRDGTQANKAAIELWGRFWFSIFHKLRFAVPRVDRNYTLSLSEESETFQKFTREQFIDDSGFGILFPMLF